MSADVKVTGTVKNARHIHYVTTRLGTRYSWRGMSIQLIRTNGKVEYRDAYLPDHISPRLRVELDKVSKHFTGIKKQ